MFFALLCFIGAIVLAGLFVLGILFVNFVCNPIPSNDGTTRIINRSKREMEQMIYSWLGSICVGVFGLIGMGFIFIIGEFLP